MMPHAPLTSPIVNAQTIRKKPYDAADLKIQTKADLLANKPDKNSNHLRDAKVIT